MNLEPFNTTGMILGALTALIIIGVVSYCLTGWALNFITRPRTVTKVIFKHVEHHIGSYLWVLTILFPTITLQWVAHFNPLPAALIGLVIGVPVGIYNFIETKRYNSLTVAIRYGLGTFIYTPAITMFIGMIAVLTIQAHH